MAALVTLGKGATNLNIPRSVNDSVFIGNQQFAIGY